VRTFEGLEHVVQAPFVEPDVDLHVHRHSCLEGLSSTAHI
jgi:hypothetical protein